MADCKEKVLGLTALPAAPGRAGASSALLSLAQEFSVSYGDIDSIARKQRQHPRHASCDADSAVFVKRNVGSASMFQEFLHDCHILIGMKRLCRLDHRAKIAAFMRLYVLSLEKREL